MDVRIIFFFHFVGYDGLAVCLCKCQVPTIFSMVTCQYSNLYTRYCLAVYEHQLHHAFVLVFPAQILRYFWKCFGLSL